MRRRMLLIVAGVAALAVLALGGAAIAGATQGDEGEQTLSGAAAKRAEAAALKETGGGSVTELERDPEGRRTYEVEVKKPNGATVDIDLDRAFKVLAVDEDADEANEAAEADEDADTNEQTDSDD